MQDQIKMTNDFNVTIDVSDIVKNGGVHVADLPHLPHLPGSDTFQFVVSRDEFMRRTRRIYTTNRFRKFQSAVQFKDSAKDFAVVLVGAGPSIADQLEVIRAMQGQAIIFALNNSHDYLIENGINVDVAMLIEAKDRAINYITPNRRTRYLLASQVADATLEKFLPFAANTYIFHCMFDDAHRAYIKELRAKHKLDVFGISGGSSVGLRAFDFIIEWMACRHLHVFGFDSSGKEPHFDSAGTLTSGGEMHARLKDGAVPAHMVTQIRAPGGRVIARKYYTDPVMRRQAGEMIEILKNRAQSIARGEMKPFGVSFHGRGLLPDWLAFLGFHHNNEEIVKELNDETEKHERETAEADRATGQARFTVSTGAGGAVADASHGNYGTATTNALGVGKPHTEAPPA